jgi:hypothetical protein
MSTALIQFSEGVKDIYSPYQRNTLQTTPDFKLGVV